MHFRQVSLVDRTAVYCEAQAKGLTFLVQLQSAKEPNEPAVPMSVLKIWICLMPGRVVVIGKSTAQLMR